VSPSRLPGPSGDIPRVCDQPVPCCALQRRSIRVGARVRPSDAPKLHLDLAYLEPSYSRYMALQRMDHVGIVVDDLASAIAFFDALGMAVDGAAPVEGDWVDRVAGLDNVRVEIAMMRTPDGHGRLELTQFHSPAAVSIEPHNALANALGIRSIMFAVDDIEDSLARLQSHGGDLIGSIEQYEETYRLCYVRGPAGIIVALAEQLS
jgi:catechol 2,3-dioxygenase-like lactoylglutathione lyase family enzyme